MKNQLLFLLLLFSLVTGLPRPALASTDADPAPPHPRLGPLGWSVHSDEQPATPSLLNWPRQLVAGAPATAPAVMPCSLAITNVSVVCTDGINFALSFDVEYDFVDAATDIVAVTVDGTTQTFVPGAALGVQPIGPIPLVGAANDVLLEAMFVTNAGCATNSTVDLVACTDACTGGLGGTVLNDENANGNSDAGETGQGNVLVEVYECDGDTPVATTLSNADGEWSIDDAAITYPVRVEFSSPLQPALASSIVGNANASAVQFVDAPSCGVNYATINTQTICLPATVSTQSLGTLSPEGTLLSSGIGFITCGVIEDASIPAEQRYVMGLVDLRNVTTANNRPQATPGDFHRSDWTVSQIGNIFGSTVDADGNFYATASSHYGSAFGYVLGTNTSNFRPAIIQYGQIGGGAQDLGAAGTVYRMDAVTGEPTVFAQLPQQSFEFTHIACETGDPITRTSGPGLGNIVDHELTGGFYVSNFEDGAIYRLDADGNIIDSFDPQTLTGFAADDGTAGFANDFKPYGLAVSPAGDRLYFGVHPVDNDATTSLTDPSVYYVELATDGSFVGTEQFVVTTSPEPSGPAFGGDVNAFGADPAWYSISDLQFTPEGRLMIGHRSGCGDGTNPVYASSHNHGATYYLYDLTTQTLTNVQTRYAGDLGTDDVAFEDGTGNDDVYGGIGIWDTHDGDFLYAVSSSDMRDEQGPHGILVFPDDFTQTGDGTTQYILRPSAAIPYFVNFATNDFKGVGGDIDVYSPCGTPPLQIGNYVWVDTDEDGVQDACEEPLAGLPVNLYTEDDNGTRTLVATTTTDANGAYYFTNGDDPDETWLAAADSVLADTSYLIVFGDTEAGGENILFNGDLYTVTQDSTGSGTNPGLNDSDATVQTTPLGALPAISYTTADTVDHSLDLGLVPADFLSLGSTVFEDDNNNGLQDDGEMGIPGVPIQVYLVVGQQDNDVNGETDDVLLTLGSDGDLQTADDGQPLITDADGNYFVTGLEPGDYYLVIPDGAFGTGSALEEIAVSSTDIATTAADNQTDGDDNGLQPDGGGNEVTSPVISLTQGDEPLTRMGADAGAEFAQGAGQDTIGDLVDANGDMTIDFGFFAPVSVGDTAFVDLDGDGLQTPGEPGIGGVTVTLLDSDGNTVTVDAFGNSITGQTTTAPDGSYLFDDLLPGSYSVVFDIGTADNAEFYAFTTAGAGDEDDDSDNDTALSPTTAQSTPTAFLTSGEQDLSLDVGLVCAVTVDVADPFTICATQTVDLTQDVSITPAVGATFGASWTTTDGTGVFLDAGGAALSAPFRFGTAVRYDPSAADAQRGSVTLTLTTDDPAGPCDPVSNSVTVQVLKVDCGEFFWDGDDDSNKTTDPGSRR